SAFRGYSGEVAKLSATVLAPGSRIRTLHSNANTLQGWRAPMGKGCRAKGGHEHHQSCVCGALCSKATLLGTWSLQGRQSCSNKRVSKQRHHHRRQITSTCSIGQPVLLGL
ncbi:unnamed protein product, partial [Ectocarpus sp. 8 AP-2014]